MVVYKWFESERASRSKKLEQTGSASQGRRIEATARGALRLTNRDRHLLGVLATARYLSSEQIHRLFFSGRTEAACRGRLFLLAGLGKERKPLSYVRRLRFRSFEGQWFSVWAPTIQGYLIARSVLGKEVKAPAYDVSAHFLEHSIRLNDLLVALLQTTDKRIPSMPRAPFHWVPSDSSRLPWQEYEGNQRGTVTRIVQPDAILEIPGLRRRLFLECEMGTHTIVTANPEKYGATTNKIDRYNKFMATYVDGDFSKTYYEQTFPDRWSPELLFLVHSQVRKEHVERAIEKMKWVWTRNALPTRALTFDEAPARIRALIETADPRALEPEPLVSVSRRDLNELIAFHNEAMASLKIARAQVRELRMPQLSLPEYPFNFEKAAEVLTRLKAILFPRPRPAA